MHQTKSLQSLSFVLFIMQLHGRFSSTSIEKNLCSLCGSSDLSAEIRPPAELDHLLIQSLK